MKRWTRGMAGALAVLMLLSTAPLTALADEALPPELPDEVQQAENEAAPDEVTYNTGCVEVTVGSDPEKAESEDLDFWYTLFDENGGHVINLDLFDAGPLFPYEVQFKYQGKTETRWFETINDTAEVNGHVFSLYSDDPQSRHSRSRYAVFTDLHVNRSVLRADKL